MEGCIFAQGYLNINNALLIKYFYLQRFKSSELIAEYLLCLYNMNFKNHLISKRSFLLIICIALSISSLAFDYKVTLQEKSFEEENYNFLIQKVIDARLNKQKPIGSLVAGFSLNKETVGNDSLAEQMISVFNSKSEVFDGKLKVAMVINQLNLRYIKGITTRGRELDELEYTIAVDYYKVGDKSYGLLYQQFFKYKAGIKSGKNTAKDLDKIFSETIKKAFTDFKKQLKDSKAFVRKELNADTLLQFLAGKPLQVINSQNIKEGLYFSCKDLYLNNPGVVSYYSFTDSMGIGQRPTIVKAPAYVLERVYAIVIGHRIFLYIGGGNYKEAVFGDDGKLFIPSIAGVALSLGEKGSSSPIGVLNSLTPATSAIKPALVDSIAKQPEKPIEPIAKATDIFIDFETGDLVSQ